MATGYAPGVLHSKQDTLAESKKHSLDGKNGTRSHQIQNVKAARVYVFGDGNVVEDDGEEVTEFEMRSRHSNAFSSIKEDPKPVFFEKEISEGETLQAIALKYACNVSDLKRLNNLIKDQEFFGLKVLKVPITRHGILSEKISSSELQVAQKLPISNLWNSSATPSDVEGEDADEQFLSENESQHDFSDPETQMKVLRTLSIRENFSSQGKEAEKFLKKMDSDLSQLKRIPRSERESLSEVISVLTNKSIHPLSTPSTGLKINGADCGISWWSLLLITLSIAIIVPLIYLFYYFVLKS